MSRRRSILCITTSKPSAVLTPGAGGTGGGGIALVDAQTGSIGSSLRVTSDMAGKVPVGATGVSIFPPSFQQQHHDNNNNNTANSSGKKKGSATTLAMAHGCTSKSKDDAYAMLLAFRSSPSVPPILHWKGRLPEGHLTGTGLSISPCGHYVVGGAHSGTLYVWTTIGGRLIQTVKAHYRAVTVVQWTPCGRFLVTGGADGMVHLFALMHLVAYPATTNQQQQSVHPIRTWSQHQLPVNDICTTLPGGRLATAGQDGLILILEASCDQVVATLQMPHGIQSLTHFQGGGNVLFAGSVQGTIYTISLDQYAIHLQTQQGVTTTVAANSNNSIVDQVFGHGGNNGSQPQQQKQPDSTEESTTDVYRTELRGHERAVTALCTFSVPSNNNNTAVGDGEQQWMLCSGDEAGTVRLWDLESRLCLYTLRPWCSTTSDAATAAAAGTSKTPTVIVDHPITSIQCVPLPPDDDEHNDNTANNETTSAAMFGGSNSSSKNGKSATTLASLIAPLQKFVEPPSATVQTPFIGTALPRNEKRNAVFWDIANDDSSFRDGLVSKRLRTTTRAAVVLASNSNTQQTDQKMEEEDEEDNETAKQQQQPKPHYQGITTDGGNDQQKQRRIAALEKELAQAKETIQRWQTVNNKLMARLQQQGQGSN